MFYIFLLLEMLFKEVVLISDAVFQIKPMDRYC